MGLAPLGGITSEESAIHVFASSFKFAAVLLMFTTKSAESDISLTPFVLAEQLPSLLKTVGSAFAMGSFFGGVYSLFPNFKLSVCHRICPARMLDETKGSSA